MTRLLRLLLTLLLPISLTAQQPDTVRVFYLGGQSNMDGYGYNKNLPDDLNQEFKDIYIFHGNPAGDDNKTGGLGLWERLRPGHGGGFKSDGAVNKPSDRFGVELSFARKLRELYPDDKIALIKYSLGGTSIDTAARSAGTWDADYVGTLGINQYDHFLTTLRQAFSSRDIDNDGKEDYLLPAGIAWMQGESDAAGEAMAMRYHANLKKLMTLMRAAFRSDDLPIVIGKISDSGQNRMGKVWKYGELVQYGQEKFVMEDEQAGIVRQTRYYDYSDPAHYNSEAYIDLGERFAQAIFDLNIPEMRLSSKAFGAELRLVSPPSDSYKSRGLKSLIDERPGSKYFDDGYWLGFEEDDLQATIDLGSVEDFESISIGLLQDVNVWIFYPRYVEISWSADGKKYSKAQRLETGVSEREVGKLFKRLSLDKRGKARYIKVTAKNIGRCPEWHTGAGGKAWLFVDEITVK